MSTKIITPVLIDLPGETLPSENTDGVVLPKGPGGVQVLIVAGGGGGSNLAGSGGGGAGGVLTGTLRIGSDLSLNTGYNIQVGAGGSGSSTASSYSFGYTNGSNSFISSWIANGGGYSAGACCISSFAGFASSGNAGGSGGGGGGYTNGSNTPGGSGNQTSISPLTGYGNDGGSCVAPTGSVYTGAGGGGAGAIGQDVNSGVTTTGTNPGVGGVGIISTIIDTTIASTNNVGEVDGSDVYFAGGGGGTNGNAVNADGGLGGGGNGRANGTAATGGGAGGASYSTAGFEGGSGVIILKYPDSLTCALSGATGLTEIVDTTSVSDFKISIFKVSSEGTDGTGTITFTGTVTYIPSNPSTGEFRYNTVDKLVEFYNGSMWKQIADEPA